MSLDVYLTMPTVNESEPRDAIFVRENGQCVEISRDEWDKRYPGREPVTVSIGSDDRGYVFSGNITHNLSAMADEAGIYAHLWRPEDIGITKAHQLIEPLKNALASMQSDPERFKAFDSPNGWGLYENFVPWIAGYLEACIDYPDADVSVWR
jgi:hypothetical protein